MADPRFHPNLDGYHDPRFDLVRLVRDRTHRATRAGHAERENVSATAVVDLQDRIRDAVRAGVFGQLDAAGTANGVGAGAPGVAPRVRTRRDALQVPGATYRIERLVLESEPGVFLPANLYLPPSRPEPRPAVLFLCGHSADGKAAPDYQRACATFAAHGYVVLVIDPIGQGERPSYTDIAPGTTEHTYAGIPCWWAGTSSARFFLADARRAFDVLSEHPDVDPGRVAVTGNSGGGMLTTLLMALEPRVAAALPGTYVTSRLDYLDSGSRQDAEQILLGATAAGLDHDALLIAMAPKPVCVLASDYDFFPIEGTLRSVARARTVYERLGAPDALELVRAAAPHRYDNVHIDRGVEFLNRVLEHVPDSNPSADQACVLPRDELRCTESGRVAADEPTARHIHDRLRALLNAAPAPEHAPRGPDWSDPDVDRARAWLRERVFAHRTQHEPHIRVLPADGAEHLLWQTEPGVWGAGLLFTGAEADVVRRVVLLDSGTEDADRAATRRLLEQTSDATTLILDVRGRGALRPYDRDGKDARDQSSSTYKILSDLLWLDDSLAAAQVYDVLFALDHLCSADVELVGVGFGAYLARLVAFLDPRVARLTVSDEYVDPDAFCSVREYDDGRGAWQGVIPGLVTAVPWPMVLNRTDRLRVRGQSRGADPV